MRSINCVAMNIILAVLVLSLCEYCELELPDPCP